MADSESTQNDRADTHRKQKLTKLFKLSFPRIRTINDNINCFFSFAIQKNIKRIFKLIIIGVNKLNIEEYEKRVGLT